MKRKVLCLFTLISSLHTLGGAGVAQSLPKGSVIVEQRVIPSAPNRSLVLWMLKPRRSNPIPDDDPYTCPDETRGNAYAGPTRVSLINRSDGQIINTVTVRDSHSPRRDTFTLPYEIRPGYYYLVNSTKTEQASRPTILNYKDYNGDGDAAEFVLYDAPFCMGLQTALIGYNKRKDRVMQYPLEINFRRKRRSWQEKSTWLEYIFSEKPVAPGHYIFTVDYRGRGGALMAYDVAYDRSLEQFQGSCIVTDQ